MTVTTFLSDLGALTLFGILFVGVLYITNAYTKWRGTDRACMKCGQYKLVGYVYSHIPDHNGQPSVLCQDCLDRLHRT